MTVSNPLLLSSRAGVTNWLQFEAPDIVSAVTGGVFRYHRGGPDLTPEISRASQERIWRRIPQWPLLCMI